MRRHARALVVSVFLTAGILVALPCPAEPGVDPSAVGTWELVVPTAQGVARWVWEIRADGTYTFRSEAPGAAPGHSGTVEVANGQWALRSPGWTDGGTYRFADQNSLVATGKLGTAMWKRSTAARRRPRCPRRPPRRSTGSKSPETYPLSSRRAPIWRGSGAGMPFSSS